MSRTVTGGSPPTSPTRSGMCRPTGGALRHRARDCAAGAGSPRRGRCVRRGWRVVAPGLADLPPIWDPGLAGEASPGSGKYVEVPGADHNDAALLAGDRLIEAVVTFLARVGIDAAL